MAWMPALTRYPPPRRLRGTLASQVALPARHLPPSSHDLNRSNSFLSAGEMRPLVPEITEPARDRPSFSHITRGMRSFDGFGLMVYRIANEGDSTCK